MGHGMTWGTGLPVFVWLPIIIVPLTFSVGLLAYLALFPEIKETPPAEKMLPKEPEPQSLSTIVKVLREDERKVVELLTEAGGTMLQRDIARKTGFSRVKTHRILHRLAGRRIVNASKHYNTYQITLADWLHPERAT